jgi:hypothetical protein
MVEKAKLAAGLQETHIGIDLPYVSLGAVDIAH